MKWVVLFFLVGIGADAFAKAPISRSLRAFPADPEIIDTSAGKIKSAGVAFVAPKAASKIKSPVEVSLVLLELASKDVKGLPGGAPELKQRADAKLKKGVFGINVMKLDEKGKPITDTKQEILFEKSKTQKKIDLKPGKYWIDSFCKDCAEKTKGVVLTNFVKFEVIP